MTFASPFRRRPDPAVTAPGPLGRVGVLADVVVFLAGSDDRRLTGRNVRATCCPG
ncbi:hypothetical protein GCM10010517_68260 [Streptosporangium fragile]|uniref:Uncharacterized protein n=1 Tax=Streptosporangium fragile TaxID=46186 RepID=A0ABN3W8K6_9ACTN